MKSLHKYISAISACVVVAAFFFLGRVLVQQWHIIASYPFQFNYYYLFVSSFFLVAGMIGFSLLWRRVVLRLDPTVQLTSLAAIRIYFYSGIARYIPSSFFLYFGRFYLANQAGVGKQTAGASVILETVYSVIGQLFTGIIMLAIVGRINIVLVIFSLVLLMFALLVIRSRFMIIFINYFLSFFKKDTLNENVFFEVKRSLGFVALYLCNGLVLGLGFYFFTLAFVPISATLMPALVGMFVLSGVLGTLAFFAPAGLGVREGLLYLFLAQLLPSGLSLVVSVASRIWLIIVELIVVGCLAIPQFIKKVSSPRV